MTELPPLERLKHREKDALIQGLWQELQALRKELENLKQKRVKKTSRNSSLPPSKGFKPNQSNSSAETTQPAESREHSGGRELDPAPDQIVVAKAKSCPHCGSAVAETGQQLRGIYDRIELPPIKAHITRVERYGGVCECCQQSYDAAVPVGLEPGSPFGTTVATMVTYLRYSHAVSYQRLSQLMGEIYGLKLSEGAIANLLQRVQQQLTDPVSQIIERLRRARLVCSDETSARVEGKLSGNGCFKTSRCVCM
jgi:transposase